MTAAEVMDRRDKPASGLRRQIGCVWPENDRKRHPGALVLWVGDEDMSKAEQPAWPLARRGGVDLFAPVPFATDQRGRPVTITLMFVSIIIGAIPRMGKTFLLRLLLLIAALDVRAELHVYDLKGTGDLAPLRPVAHRYRAGDEPEDMDYLVADFRQLRDRDAPPHEGDPPAGRGAPGAVPGEQGDAGAGQPQGSRPAPDRGRGG